jgi:hypothetical protein
LFLDFSRKGAKGAEDSVFGARKAAKGAEVLGFLVSHFWVSQRSKGRKEIGEWFFDYFQFN